MVVEHSVAIRVRSFEDLQLTRRPALHRLLMHLLMKWLQKSGFLSHAQLARLSGVLTRSSVLRPATFAMTYKLVVAAVGLCRHTVGIGGGFSCEWSNGNEFWDLVVVRNLVARCGSSSCLISTAAVGQQFVDREGSVFYVKMLEMFKKVTGAVHVHILHHQLRAAEDKADGNGLNSSVLPYAMAVHSDSSQHAAEEAFLRFARNAADAKFCKGHFTYINAWRNITTDPIENNHSAVCDETYLVSPDDNLASDLFLPGASSM